MSLMTTTTWRAGVAGLLMCSLVAVCGSVAPAAAQSCVGDCSGDGSVTVDEIVTMVNIALGTAEVATCPAADPSGEGSVTVDEILQGVNNALEGCPPSNGCTTALVTVMLDFDPSAADLAGIELELDYPTAALTMPGSGSDAEVTARVTDVTGVGGFFSVADLDTDTDGTDDRLRTSAVVVGASYGPGAFEEARFDCATGADLPVPGDFTCSIVGASDSFGNPIDLGLIGCSLTVGAP